MFISFLKEAVELLEQQATSIKTQGEIMSKLSDIQKALGQQTEVINSIKELLVSLSTTTLQETQDIKVVLDKIANEEYVDPAELSSALEAANNSLATLESIKTDTLAKLKTDVEGIYTAPVNTGSDSSGGDTSGGQVDPMPQPGAPVDVPDSPSGIDIPPSTGTPEDTTVPVDQTEPADGEPSNQV